MRNLFRSFDRRGVDYLLISGQASILYGAATFSEDLVALKETRRLADYEVISNLSRVRVSGEAHPPRRLLEWAARHTYRAEDRAEYLRRAGRRTPVAECRRGIAAEIRRLQARDAAWWRPIVRELRDLRRRGMLLEEGTPAAALAREGGRPTAPGRGA